MRQLLPPFLAADPLALSSGVGARMLLVLAVLAGLWGAVLWALAA
ncbi:hypothetical protein [Falsiroseomonas tokyonensis]|uniref:Uncharacterized protein n=1 Tax=Falsiroseomonas tokyonensis TaxID=430521 RepID=A0ABV7BVJ7_9PROT|nr:hypothetical protein [Falsiroseomonas tokyonensis]